MPGPSQRTFCVAVSPATFRLFFYSILSASFLSGCLSRKGVISVIIVNIVAKLGFFWHLSLSLSQCIRVTLSPFFAPSHYTILSFLLNK